MSQNILLLGIRTGVRTGLRTGQFGYSRLPSWWCWWSYRWPRRFTATICAKDMALWPSNRRS